MKVGDYVKTRFGQYSVVLAVTDDWVIVKICDSGDEMASLKRWVTLVEEKNDSLNITVRNGNGMEG